jgi:hypothetical protein
VAQTDAAVIVPSVGYIWTGVVGTAVKPTTAQLATFASAGTVPATWTNLGHTDLDDILAPGQDGGDTEVKGSWQNPSLRTVITEASVDYFVIKSLQILDRTVLGLYYGSGGDNTTANEYGSPNSPAATELAVSIVMVDGSNPVTAVYMAKASFLREDNMEFDSADFVKAPIRITALQSGSIRKIIWISTTIGAAI